MSAVALVGLIAASSPASAAPRTVVPAAQPGIAKTMDKVLVRSDRGADGAARAVKAVGGSVGRRLGIIGGVSATVRADRVNELMSEPGITSVTPDQAMHPRSVDPNLGYDATGDFGSMSAITTITGVQTAWAKGYSGKGIDVALIDTGVAPVPDAGTTVKGPDLSFDYQGNFPAGLDEYGHGTHMAGIINGHDPTATGTTVTPTTCPTCLNTNEYSDTTKYVGIAPQARVINVKVGAFDGGTDMSQVIAAIDWVVKNQTANKMNIKIINLSFGTQSTNPYTSDPLAFACEMARKKGILVVAAAGNDGNSSAQLEDPAYDPSVLAVGASDPMSTYPVTDDTVASFSNSGTTTRKVDVVAPGVHVISLRDPGSYIDVNYGSTGLVGTSFFRGSGTSQATAVVSGIAAVLYQKYPSATPDAMKKLIMSTTSAIAAGAPVNAVGNGTPNAGKAVVTALPNFTQSFTAGTGTGLIENARGGVHVTSGGINGVDLVGEKDIFGHVWNSTTWAKASAGGTSWSGGSFLGNAWSGSTWTTAGWTDLKWTHTDWNNLTWSSHLWSSESWDSHRWSGDNWSGAVWSSHRWSATFWSGFSNTTWS